MTVKHNATLFVGRLRLAACVAQKLRAHHLAPGKSAESCSYVLGHAFRGPDGEPTIVLADPDTVLLFAPDCFVGAGYGHVTLDKEVKARVFQRAVDEGYSAVVDVHDHHFAQAARFSSVDDRDDRSTARYVGETVQRYMPRGRELVAAALLISRGDWDARTAIAGANGRTSFGRLRVDCVGETFRMLSALEPLPHDGRLVRHDGIVSPRAQQLLRRSQAVVVGGGGTGSIAVECLLRIGIGSLSVIDADRVELGNLNRLQGAGCADVGRLKIDVLRDNAARMAPGTRFTGVPFKCHEPQALAALESADFIVGCVDNAETRWWLNRLAAQYMIPWFDCAVALTALPRVVHEVRASTVIPRTISCGHCSHVEFLPRTTPSRYLDLETMRVQRAAGYITDEPEAPSPSTYAVNMQAVSMLMQEVMNWFCGWRPAAASIYMRSDANRVERLDASVTDIGPAEGCPVCDAMVGKCRESWTPREDVDLAAMAAAFDSSSPPNPPTNPERSSPWPSPTPNA